MLRAAHALDSVTMANQSPKLFWWHCLKSRVTPEGGALNYKNGSSSISL
jgi:hypothetical protein